MKSTEQLLQPRVEEDTDSYIDDDEDAANTVACYYLTGSDGVDGADDSQSKDGEEKGRTKGVSFDSRLGLAIESIQPGVTMDQLWRVI